jgi:hypothetical protein
MQRFVLGKLSRTELLATLEAIRRIVMPSGGACGIACLWQNTNSTNPKSEPTLKPTPVPTPGPSGPLLNSEQPDA